MITDTIRKMVQKHTDCTTWSDELSKEMLVMICGREGGGEFLTEEELFTAHPDLKEMVEADEAKEAEEAKKYEEENEE